MEAEVKTEMPTAAKTGTTPGEEKSATDKKKEEEDEKAEISSIRFKGTSEVRYLYGGYREYFSPPFPALA